MTYAPPLVTILITTKDRPEELAHTLRQLRRLTYPNLGMLVIDDGSATPLEPVVHSVWPEAVCVREAHSAGCPMRRTQGFSLATGKYILELDDDSYPVNPDALRVAVSFMERSSSVGALAFHIFNGCDLPCNLPRPQAQYTASFVGCGVLFRKAAIEHTGGFLPFFQSEGEEPELALRMMKKGWTIRFFPDVLIHHHVSPRNRRTARSWMRNFRNKLWSHIMHYPLRRLPFEMGWTLAVAVWDSIRLLRLHYLIRGIAEFLLGLPRALSLREPMSPDTLRLYDALRWRGVFTEAELKNPPVCSLRDIWRWYRKAWKNRPRQRSFWDRRPGDIGSSPTVAFAHEYLPGKEAPPSKQAPHEN
jgi:GT2 family glycosyltransferase